MQIFDITNWESYLDCWLSNRWKFTFFVQTLTRFNAWIFGFLNELVASKDLSYSMLRDFFRNIWFGEISFRFLRPHFIRRATFLLVTTFVISKKLLHRLLIDSPLSRPLLKSFERLARASGCHHVLLSAVPVPLVDLVRLQVKLKRKLIDHVSIPVDFLGIARLQDVFLSSRESLTLVLGAAAFWNMSTS